jgi:alpha-tubulin suppressor-like RCC1 family protein
MKIPKAIAWFPVLAAVAAVTVSVAAPARAGTVFGDTNQDGSFSMADLNVMVDWILMRTSPPSPGSQSFENADVDANGVAGMADLNYFVDRLLGRITAFPVETTGIHITAQPAGLKVLSGQIATFTVAACGAQPISYQWKANSANIQGATSPSYTTPFVSSANNGCVYQCVVANSAGSLQSDNAALTVTATGPGQEWTSGDYLGQGLSSFPPNGMTTRFSALPGMTGIKAIAFGCWHSVALDSGGNLWTCGSNIYGGLGDGTGKDHSTMTQLLGLTNLVAVTAGLETTIVLRGDGTVWAWGRNDCGQVGDGTSTHDNVVNCNRLSPVQALVQNIRAISSGEFTTVALDSNGEVWAWGLGDYGQLGQASLPYDNPVPTKVPNLTNVIAIAGGGRHTVALRSDGTVWTFGWNGSGQLGNGTVGGNNPHPAQVPGLTNVRAIAAGYRHTAALRGDGTVVAWGSNAYGNLGCGITPDKSPVPVQVPGLANVLFIAGGYGNEYTFAALGDGTFWAWGDNRRGQLGTQVAGVLNPYYSPVQVPFVSNVQFAAAGDDASGVIVP